MKPYLRCVDIHSAHCPCLLADTNHCLMCSHLRGESVCDCEWSGLCLLNEKRWQSTPSSIEPASRQELETTFNIKRRVSEHTYLIEVEVGAELAAKLNAPGSFVFLRRAEDPKMCTFPLGVMDVNQSRLTLAVEAIGPKSCRLFLPSDNRVLLRGPYTNGIFGQPWIETTKCGTIVAVVGGLGQANAIMLAKKIIANNNKAVFIVAPGRAKAIFVAEELRELGVEVITVNSMRQEGFTHLFKLMNHQVDLLLSAGPDELHHAVIQQMQDAGYNYPMAVTNNATMCCGEGICGSCAKLTKDGNWIRTCKIQVDFDNLEH